MILAVKFFYTSNYSLMRLLAWEFLLIKSVLHFAFLHILSGNYYYDYVVICALRVSWFTEILF